jgi:hypothetical protein
MSVSKTRALADRIVEHLFPKLPYSARGAYERHIELEVDALLKKEIARDREDRPFKDE